MTKPIPFIDLAAQSRLIRPQIDAAIKTVLDHGQYIMGPEVAAFEEALSDFTGTAEVVSCSSGTDALLLGLQALGVGAGDGVIVPSFTFAATAEVMPLLGAIPIFADIDGATFNLSPAGLDAALAAAKQAGIKVAGIIAVDLFGQPADYTAIGDFAAAHGLWLVSDAAQSLGATLKGQAAGGFGALTATSFFPAKPLGCYGDGGAVLTADADLASAMRSARFHGMGAERYHHDRIGMTARLDSIQAAILLEKLKIFDAELVQRQVIADRYGAGLSDYVDVPMLQRGATSSWAQYVITLKQGSNRGQIQKSLTSQGIPTAIYYPMGMHEQLPYRDFPTALGGLPVTEDLCSRVLALPMHPYLDEFTQARIINGVIDAITQERG